MAAPEGNGGGGGGFNIGTLLAVLSGANGLMGALRKQPEEEIQPNMGPRPYGGLSIMDLMRFFQQRRG